MQVDDYTATTLLGDYLPVSMPKCTMFWHNSRRKWSTSGLVFVTFNQASLSLNILTEDFIPSVHVSVMLMFNKFVNNVSISLDKRTEICWNILSTKMKMFCSEQLEITCNFTTFNTIAQNKNTTQ